MLVLSPKTVPRTGSSWCSCCPSSGFLLLCSWLASPGSFTDPVRTRRTWAGLRLMSQG